MHRIHVVLGMTALFAAALLFAQSDSDYQGYMKTVAATNGSLQKNIAAKDASAVAADANKLQDTFKQVEAFWQKRNTADAVNFAKQAQNIAATVAADASANNMDKAGADAKSIGAVCGGCHMAHRDKTEAGFKIK